MNPHDSRHEEVLSALLAETSGEASELPEALHACPTCRTEWARLHAASARLRAAAAHQRDVLEEAAQDHGAPGEDRLLATLEHLATSERDLRAPARRASSRRRLVAAAALLGLAWLAWRALSVEAPRAPLWLGDEAFEHLEPCGQVETFARFAWTYNGPAASFELWIRYDEDGQPGAVIEHVTCEQASWTPDASALASWPRRIHWRVQARNAFGDALGSASSLAWLSED